MKKKVIVKRKFCLQFVTILKENLLLFTKDLRLGRKKGFCSGALENSRRYNGMV